MGVPVDGGTVNQTPATHNDGRYNPDTIEGWAQGWLESIGAGILPADDPRMQLLIGMAQIEGTYNYKGHPNPNNPLDIEYSGNIPHGDYNPPTPVATFATQRQGYQALTQFLSDNGMGSFLQMFKTGGHTLQALGSALAATGWNNGKPNSAGAQQYANEVVSAGSNGQYDTTAAGGGKYGNAQAGGGAAGGGGGRGNMPSAGYTFDPATGQMVSTSQGGGKAAWVGPGLLGPREEYTGAGAYRGFDLHSLSPQLIPEAKKAIDQFLSSPGEEQKVLTDVYNNYAEDSWAASIPEIRTLLIIGSMLGWENDPNIFKGQVERTEWWRTHNDNQRMWEQTVGEDPAQAQAAIQQAEARVTDIANQLGVQLDGQTLRRIAETVASNSVTKSGAYSNIAISDQRIYEMVAAHFTAQQFLASTGGQQAVTAGQTSALGAPVTATPARGDAASLQNAFETIARNYYLPLTPNQIARYVAQYIRADTGEPSFLTGAVAGFTTDAQQLARQYYPALGGILGTTTQAGSDNTPYQALAGYRSLIAQYTGYGADPDTINLLDPQWSWILKGTAPGAPPAKPTATTPPPASNPNTTPTPGSPAAFRMGEEASKTGATTSSASGTGSSSTAAPTLPTYDAVQQYLMQQPQFQTTDLGKQMGWHVGSQILKSFGFS